MTACVPRLSVTNSKESWGETKLDFDNLAQVNCVYISMYTIKVEAQVTKGRVPHQGCEVKRLLCSPQGVLPQVEAQKPSHYTIPGNTKIVLRLLVLIWQPVLATHADDGFISTP